MSPLITTQYDLLTFEELAHLSAANESLTLFDGYENSVRCLIRFGSGLCAYVGVPADHPLAGFAYDDIPLEVHGGLTFANKWEDFPGWWFYGWDYSHSGDRSFHNVLRPLPGFPPRKSEHGWTVPEVANELWNVTYQFEKLRGLTERILAKSYKLVPVEAKP